MVTVPKIKPRDYQTKHIIDPARDAFRNGANGVVCVAPTGAGKTAVAAYMAGNLADKGKRILQVVHKQTIQKQMLKTFHDFGIKRGSIHSGGRITDHPVQVAMVSTLINRLDAIPNPDWIIVDESHHMTDNNMWGKLVKHYRTKNPDLKLIGFTATPQGRVDGFGLHRFADALVPGPTPQTLIDEGWLVYPKTYSKGTADFHITRGDFDTKEQEDHFSGTKVVGDAIEHYHQYLDGLPTIVSCVSLKHAKYMADQYNREARLRGKSWKAVMVQGGKKYERQLYDAIKGMGNGSVQVVTFCEVFGEGVDVPYCSGIQMMRKTLSLVLYLQFIGRTLRPIWPHNFDQYASTAAQRRHTIATGPKPYAVILDHAGNFGIHGHPAMTRQWSLEDTIKGRGRTKNPPMTTTCPKCTAVWDGKPIWCPDCGFNFVEAAKEENKKGRKLPKQIAGHLEEVGEEEFIRATKELEEMTPGDRHKAMLHMLYKNGRSDRLKHLETQLGYKKGWAYHAWKRKK